MSTYLPDYKPKNAEQFAELEREFGSCANVEALKFRIVLYTMKSTFDREDIMVAIGRTERAKGWRL